MSEAAAKDRNPDATQHRHALRQRALIHHSFIFSRRRECNASFLAHRDLAATKRLYPRIQSFRTWALNNKDAIAALA